MGSDDLLCVFLAVTRPPDRGNGLTARMSPHIAPSMPAAHLSDTSDTLRGVPILNGQQLTREQSD